MAGARAVAGSGRGWAVIASGLSHLYSELLAGLQRGSSCLLLRTFILALQAARQGGLTSHVVRALGQQELVVASSSIFLVHLLSSEGSFSFPWAAPHPLGLAPVRLESMVSP